MIRTESLKGKIVFITGSSSGIGKACAQYFAELGADLIITARRVDRLKALAAELVEKYGIKCVPLQLDVQDNKQVESVFEQLKKDQFEPSIIVNNAGLALSTDTLQDGKVANWEIMIDTNIKGLLYVTRAALPYLLERNEGHIVNIGSVAGHGIYKSGNVYSATKHAVNALTKSLRVDLSGTKIRVSEVDPGAVETEFSEVRWNDKEKAKQMYKGFKPLVPEDVADGVVYCVTRPAHVNIEELIIYPQAQASLTEIHREGEVSKYPFDTKS